jgi:hypothetical protein
LPMSCGDAQTFNSALIVQRMRKRVLLHPG